MASTTPTATNLNFGTVAQPGGQPIGAVNPVATGATSGAFPNPGAAGPTTGQVFSGIGNFLSGAASGYASPVSPTGVATPTSSPSGTASSSSSSPLNAPNLTGVTNGQVINYGGSQYIYNNGTFQPYSGNGATFNGKTYLPGMAAPSGYSWNSTGTGFIPTNTIPTPQTNPSTTASASSLGETTAYQDLLNAINENVTSYNQSAQQDQAELDAENQLIQSIQSQQNLKNQVLGNQLSFYGRGVPLSLAQSQYQNVGFGAQVAQLGAQNAVNIAQQQLGLEQTNRQIRSQVAQNVLNASLSEAGLMKPESVSPGSSLVSPNGQVAYQGSGFTAPSLSDVASLANSFLASGQAPDYNTAYSMAVSALQSGFGTNSNTTASSLGANGNNSGSTTPMSNGSTIMGYNMGNYATDPNYVSELTSTISEIPNTVTTPNSIQSYIDSVAPNSPITGQMVYSAASQYGVDPRMLLGVMQHESQFGTAGEATTTFNPGNVGNTDSGATKNMGSWQSGVNALARNLQGRYVGNTGNQPAQSQATNFSTARSMMPPQLSPALEQTSDGTMFLDQDKIPSTMSAFAQTFSASSGIPILTPDEVTKARALDVTTQNLNNISQLLPSTLGSGIGGKITDTLKTWWNNITGTDQNRVALANYREAAINAIQAMGGGSGSGFRLNQAEIDNAVQGLPTATDTLEQAQTKIATFTSMVNEWHNEIFPNDPLPTNINTGSNTSATDAYLNSLFNG